MALICTIDDHVGCREGIQVLLEDMGHQTEGFNSAEDFLAADSSFDQIILDISLPGKSGIELLAHLRASGITTPVILYSGLPEKTIRRSYRRFENTVFLSKPFRLNKLLALLSI